MRRAFEALDGENAAAWRLFQDLNTRFVVDRGLTSCVLTRTTADLDTQDYGDTIVRLSIIYNALAPARKVDDGA